MEQRMPGEHLMMNVGRRRCGRTSEWPPYHGGPSRDPRWPPLVAPPLPSCIATSHTTHRSISRSHPPTLPPLLTSALTLPLTPLLPQPRSMARSAAAPTNRLSQYFEVQLTGTHSTITALHFLVLDLSS